MNKHQENLATAHKELLGYLEANSTALAVIPNYVASVALYKSMFDTLTGLIDTQQTNMKAYTLDRELKRKALVEAIRTEASKLGFLGYDEKDEPLMLRAKMMTRGLLRKRDTILVSSARILLAELNAYSAELMPYGVTAVTLVELKSLMDAYSSVIDEKSVAFGQRVSATASIERQLKAMQPLVGRLKAMVRTLKDPVLMGQFETAAKVKHLGVRRYNLTGIVMDEEDKLAIHKAQVTVYGPEGKLSTVLTNENGAYRFLSLPTGEYKMVVEKDGFVEHIHTFEILPKNKQAIDVELEFDNSGEAADAETDSGMVA